MTRDEVLLRAQEIINGERDSDYGSALDNHNIIVNLWNIYFDGRHSVTPEDVAIMMILLKVGRLIHTHTSDSFVDIAGYAALAEEMVSTQNVIEFRPEE